MSKLNRYRRKGESDPLEHVTDVRHRKRIRWTLQAIEGFVLCSCIATGVVQLLALRFSGRTPALVLPLSSQAFQVHRLGGNRRGLST